MKHILALLLAAYSLHGMAAAEGVTSPDGKIKVESDTTAEEPAAENITVNFQGNLK